VTSSLSVAALRQEFDASFALPPRETARDLVDLLAIRVAGRPYALRLAEVGGVATGRRATRVPSPLPALAGLVGLRGMLVAVFDLGVLLGHSPEAGTSRWVAVCGGRPDLAVAFNEVEGHLRLPPTALELREDTAGGLVEQVIRSESGLRPIVSIPWIVRVVSKQSGRGRPGKANS